MIENERNISFHKETIQEVLDRESENRIFRFKMLASAADESNENCIEIRNLIMKKLEEDPIFFFDNFLYTYNPKLENSTLPFILYNFQRWFILDVVECIENDKDCITEKSRDMWYSWLMSWIILWWFLFKWWSSLVWSYKQDYVDSTGSMDSIFEKIRYMIQYLPKWMLPEGLEKPYMKIYIKGQTTEIIGDAGENFWTWWRKKFIFLDEFALWNNDKKAFRKTTDIAKCRIFWWTPEWRYNVYWKIMTNHPDFKDLSIKKLRLHWSQHPLKTQEWYEIEKSKRTKLDVAKELDISYDDSVSGAVYNDFLRLVKFWKYKYNPELPLYTWWDFWLDMNAVIFWQKDYKTNQIYIVDAIQRTNWNIEKFAAFVTWIPTQWFKDYTAEDIELINSRYWISYAGHYGDPYNSDSRTTVTESTIRTSLEKYWIFLITNRDSTLAERIRKTTLALNRLNVEEDLIDFTRAITQSRYPQKKDGAQNTTEQTKPIHNENSHFRTALEYAIDNELTITIKQLWQEYLKNSPNQINYWFHQQRRKVYNPITGEYK